MTGKIWRNYLLLKILPHLADTLLILSGLSLVFIGGFSFSWWIIMKIGLLVEYALFSAKYFSRKNPPKNDNFFYLALLCLSGAVLLGYYH